MNDYHGLGVWYSALIDVQLVLFLLPFPEKMV